MNKLKYLTLDRVIFLHGHFPLISCKDEKGENPVSEGK